MSESTISAPQKPRPKPQFIFADKSSVIDTYQSFAKNGFAHLMSQQAEFPYEQKNKFLSSVEFRTYQKVLFLLLFKISLESWP